MFQKLKSFLSGKLKLISFMKRKIFLFIADTPINKTGFIKILKSLMDFEEVSLGGLIRKEVQSNKTLALALEEGNTKVIEEFSLRLLCQEIDNHNKSLMLRDFPKRQNFLIKLEKTLNDKYDNLLFEVIHFKVIGMEQLVQEVYPFHARDSFCERLYQIMNKNKLLLKEVSEKYLINIYEIDFSNDTPFENQIKKVFEEYHKTKNPE